MQVQLLAIASYARSIASKAGLFYPEMQVIWCVLNFDSNVTKVPVKSERKPS